MYPGPSLLGTERNVEQINTAIIKSTLLTDIDEYHAICIESFPLSIIAMNLIAPDSE